MKKAQIIVCLIAAAILLMPLPVRGAEVCAVPGSDAPDFAAEAVYLLDIATGRVLYEKSADEPLFPASTTKIMTAMLLLEYADINEVVTVGEEITRIGPNSSTAKLKVGNSLTVAELVYAMMLPSGNDAAYTAAVYVAGKVTGNNNMDIDEALSLFAGLMNSRAWTMGAVNTNFVVPDGYHDPGHVSTARDLALITLEARKNHFLQEVVSAAEYHWQGIRWPNTNQLINPDNTLAFYPWATGFKTGYTGSAGHCLVATARGDGRELLGVLLKSTQAQRWLDARNLLEYGFNSWQNYAMLVEDRQIFMVPVTGQRRGEPEYAEIIAGGTFSDLFHVDQIARLELDFDWAKGVVQEGEGLVLRAPIREGEVLGLAIISLDGVILAEIEMISAYEIKGFNWWLLVGVGAGSIGLIAILMKKRRKKPRRYIHH